MTLEELYKAVETFRKAGISLNDLEVQIAEKEKELINNKIIPELIDSITPILKQVCSELSLVVNYVPGQPLSVLVSRQNEPQEDVTGEVEQPIPVDPPMDTPDANDPHVPNDGVVKPLPEPPQPTKGPRTMLRINFADGTVIEEPEAAETFRQFILKVGVDRVRALGKMQNKVPLVSDTIDSKYKSQVRKLVDGWYLMTWSDTETKRKDILDIAEKLGIDITVEKIAKPKKK